MKTKLQEYIDAQAHKIDTHIPPPKHTGYWNGLAERMKIGDSVLVKDDQEAKILKQAICLVHKNFDEPKYKPKSKSMKANDKGEYRVWRVL